MPIRNSAQVPIPVAGQGTVGYVSLEAVVNAVVGLSLMALCWWSGFGRGWEHRLWRPTWIAWSVFTIVVMSIERRWWSVLVVAPALVLLTFPRRNRQTG